MTCTCHSERSEESFLSLPFEDPVAIEGFVSVGGKVQRFNRREEFERIVNDMAF